MQTVRIQQAVTTIRPLLQTTFPDNYRLCSRNSRFMFTFT